MTPALPAPIAAYVGANARFDVEGMLAPFAPQATVLDEQRCHRGREAIRAWIEQATVGNQAVLTPHHWRLQDGLHIVDGAVTGAFPGSPVALSFRFTLEQGSITRLEIV